MAIQIRRGTNTQWEGGKSNIVEGEPAITTDTGRFFVGTGTGTYQEFLKVADDGTIKTPKIITEDSQGDEYPLIMDNGTELWIGGVDTSSAQHNGRTYIATGYDPANNVGYDTIRVAVPNATNTGAAEYNVWHSGNYRRYYSDPVTNSSMTLPSGILAAGYIGNSGQQLQFFIPWPAMLNANGTGNIAFSRLSIQIITGTGERVWVRSGSSGGTYTALTTTFAEIITDGSYTRTKEITAITQLIKSRSGIKIAVDFKYALSKSSSSATTVTSPMAVTVAIGGTFTITA